MHEAFGTVVWVVCVLAAVFAVAALILSRRTWEDYGRNHLLLDRDAARDPKPGSAAALVERDAEIRQLLEARNARRARRGETTVDIEQELRRLTGPRIDSALRSEIRDLVVARNHRRVRRGEPPLDVDTEIERQIAQLNNL